MRKIFSLLLFLTSLTFGQSELLLLMEDESYSFPIEDLQNSIPNFISNYQSVNTGTDDLLNIVIEGSSIFGLNSSGYGYADTTSCQFGIWTKLQAWHLDTLLQYSSSDLKYYNRSNTDITYGGTWYPENGQWASYYTGGKKYKETNETGAYVEITATNIKHLAIVFEAQNAGDSMVCTINGILPSVAGITGEDTISTYYARTNYWISLKHEYYSNLHPDSTYTFRFTKLRDDNTKYCKIAGFMTWKMPSINFITTAESGMGSNHIAAEFYEHVSVHNPDLVIWQTHDINDINNWSMTYTYHSRFLDSLNSNSYEFLVVEPNQRETVDATKHLSAYNSLMPLFVTNNIPVLDFFQYFRDKPGSDTYDGVHPNLAAVIDYAKYIGQAFGTITLDPEILDYNTRLTTPLSNTYLTLQSTMFGMLKDSLSTNILTNYFDRLWVYANETEESTLRSIINPSSTLSTKSGSPTFTKDQGWALTNTNYLNTKFNYGTGRIMCDTNNISYGIYCRVFTTGGYDFGYYATNKYLTLSTKYTNGDMVAQINSSTSLTLAEVNGLGLFTAARSGANAYLYKAGTLKVSNLAYPQSNSFSNELLVGRLGSQGLGGDKQFSILFIAKYLDATEIRKVNNCFEWYMDQLGTGVQ